MTKSKSIVLPQYNDNLLRALLSLTVQERVLPGLKPEEVLVKMEAAPCNPSDIAFLRGGYNIVKPLPAVPGFEGTGRVIKAGKNAEDLEGKRVSCFVQSNHDGTWAEHFIARKKDCFVIKDGLDKEQAACFAINPMTAYALFEQVEKYGTGAIIQNAAAGQVARFIKVFAREKGIRVINIVRKDAHVADLKHAGAEVVLCSSHPDFSSSLQDACEVLKPGIAFDAVGGELTATMVNALPSNGKVVVYGALSGGRISGIDPMGIIFKGKKLKGFNLNDWLDSKNYETVQTIAGKIQDSFISRKMTANIQGTYPLEQAIEGIRNYIRSMSAGKILFTP